MFSVSSCSPAEIHILLPLEPVARAERIGLEVVAVGHGARGDVATGDEPACGSLRHIVPNHGRRTRCCANTSCCSGVPCAISRLALPLVSMRVAADRRCWPCRRRRWPPSRRRRAAACRRCRSPAPRPACPIRRRPPAPRAWPRAGCTLLADRTTRLLRVARRLKGANFSRAMRSQVSSTDAKVSRECSAKRGRCSSWCTPSQSCSRKSRVWRMAGRSQDAMAWRVSAIVAEARATCTRGLPADSQ